MKCPFFIVEDFISPKTSDYIVEQLGLTVCDTDENERPICSVVELETHPFHVLFERVRDILPDVEKLYEVEHRGTSPMTLSWHPGGAVDGGDVRCANAVHVNRQWIKNKDRDITFHLFLSDYNDNVDAGFDPDFECYGGKLQFPQHDFSFNPKIGTLIAHPSGPHFLHAYSQVLEGDLFYVTFHIATKELFMYDPKKFPGTYETWFADR